MANKMKSNIPSYQPDAGFRSTITQSYIPSNGKGNSNIEYTMVKKTTNYTSQK